jgi:esterase/lipase
MVDYSNITAAIVQEAAAAAKANPLRNDLCRPIYLFQPKPAAKVCLFFHGFTAAPYQFLPMAQTLFQAGYSVVVPLMPGHGLAGGSAGEWGPLRPPPLPEQAALYQDFATKWLKRCLPLGKEVIVGGLSGGGTLAAWLGLEQPAQVKKLMLYAPYFRGSSPVLDLFTRLVNRYQEWVRPKGAPAGPGYPGFNVPALRVFLDMGEDVLKRSAHQLSAPAFVISSQSDMAVNNTDHRTYMNQVLDRSPKSWYLCFDKVNDIPHTMMTQAEGNRYEYLLTRLSKGYLESDLTWAEIAEIGYRMGRGQQFGAAVTQLGLQSRASVDMPTVMTMIDKRQFVESRLNDP